MEPMGAEGGIPGYLPGTAPLIQLLMLVPAICVHVPWALSSITQQGYVFVGEDRLREIADHHLPEIVEIISPVESGLRMAHYFIEVLRTLAGRSRIHTAARQWQC